MGDVDDKHVGQDNKFCGPKGQLHDMTDLIPAEAHEPLIILNCLTLGQDNVGFKVRFPLDFVRCGGRSPFGKIGRLMAARPFVKAKGNEVTFI